MTRAVAVAVSVLVAGSAVVGMAPGAGAASPTWQSRSLPWSTAGPVQATVTGVSCASATRCVAVGSALLPPPAPATATTAFVANLVGGSWLQGLLPLPSGAVDAALSGVSCPSAAHCVAVGSYSVPSGSSTVSHALVETFANGAWSPQVGLDPAGATSATLSGVSCAGASACSASGTAQAASGSEAFVSRLAKGAWNSVTLALPTGATTDSLASISCSTSNRCVAVGSTSLNVALMEVDVAGVWTATQASTVSGSSLASVSCTSTTACVAVGGGGGRGIAEVLAGTTWTADTSLPSFAALNSVSCPPTSTTCTAWGPGPVVETLTSGTWSQVPTSGLPSGGNPGPVGSCATAASCLAFEYVGDGYPKTFAVLTGASGTWTSAYLPGPPDAGLVNVACSTVTCVGVGMYYDASGSQFTSVLGLVHGRWIPVANPLPYSYLAPPSVSCAGRFCAAVSGQSAAESTDGTTWAVQTLPIPAGLSSFDTVDAVSCWAPGACIAVGTPLGGGQGTFAETLSGGTWTATVLPSAAGTGTLAGISCVSAVSCTAVGSADSTGIQSMVERLVGTSWTSSVLPAVSGAVYGSLADVSCTSTTRCVAVGSWFPQYGGAGNPLAAVLAGGTWTQAMVGAGAQTGGFRSVGCASPGTCDAVGNGQAMQLAGGVWSAITVPLPVGATSLSLSSARCVSAGWCVLAGAGIGPAPVTGEVQQTPLIATSGAPAPVITSPTTATTTVGVAASITLKATSAPAAAISVQGALPAGFTVVRHADGTATLAGTATAGDVGTYPLTVLADNGITAPTTQAFTLTVT